jgi:hypothetical protein
MTRTRLLVGIHVFGLSLACWLARAYFQHPPSWIHFNHEGAGYAARLLEFRDLIGAGYFSPQWATHFRMGLGSPYFGYYQPGVFYAAALMPWDLAPIRALGLAIILFGWLGFASMYGLIARFFGPLSGLLAASLLLTSVYAGTEIYVRGDLSEFSALMVYTATLCALATWIDEGRLHHLAALALAGAAVIVTHPAIALVGYGLLASIIGVLLFDSRTRRRALAASGAIAAGTLFAAFYWMPVFLEWDLVTPQAAFSQVYHYSKHFVNGLAVLGPYTRDTLVPFTLGPIVPALIAFNIAWILYQRRSAGRAQRVVASIAAVVLAGVWFGMTEASGWAWQGLDLLQRLQFPWRLLAFMTIFSSGLAGAMLPWRFEKARAGLVACVIGASLALSVTYTAHERHPDKQNLVDVAAIEEVYFAPDIRDEWMPFGADKGARARLGSLPEASGGAEIHDFERAQGVLRAQVRAPTAGKLVLPHYYFPVGWAASLNGQRVELTRDRDGLMQVELPIGAEGELEIRFEMTPMRSLGLVVSTASLFAGVALLVALRRRASIGGPTTKAALP